jgi:acyl-coenzyme A thioesterase PaaI-like protein
MRDAAHMTQDDVTQDDVTAELSIQERLYPQLTCFGCGHANARGLKLRSYPRDEVVIAAFRPWPEHDNGFGFLNGGIIATVLDCHSGAAVFHRAHQLGMDPPPGAPLLFVTAGLDLRYLRPVPLGQELELRAGVTEADADQVTVEAELVWDGKPRAAATTLWKRWRPR